ncbi:hypothetical protein OS493_003960 [Desmophyllum pertusum]|uniref:Uncharacterized protein n=1 Tax=Desmophyllum pertusum TaxID=174260 RepID=A0A9X0D4G9_9CNID|nr:hypothetical protein OS493_003960 [Desmophyllum pertusum]
MLFSPGVQCDLFDQSKSEQSDFYGLKSPSLKSFVQASTTVQDQELHLSGLAVFSKLANACQPIVDVSKSKIQVDKIALVRLANETVCSLHDLAVNAQNAGYSMLMCFYCHDLPTGAGDTGDKLLIPVAYIGSWDCQSTNTSHEEFSILNEAQLLAADQTNVEIRIQVPADSDDLYKMGEYLERLYYWFLLGPIITLEWLRRTKKLCGMSADGQHIDRRLVDDEERATGDEDTVVTVSETDLHSVAEETPRNDDQETEELQPLITVMNDSRTNLSVTSEHTRHIAIYRRVTTIFGNFLKKYTNKVPVGFAYGIAIIAALPVGISSGGSLINLKLTALRTVAIALTLSLSFSTSMQIICKLIKPRKSLFSDCQKSSHCFRGVTREHVWSRLEITRTTCDM